MKTIDTTAFGGSGNSPPLKQSKLAGQRFGSRVVLSYLGNKRYQCRCDCGRESIVSRSGLRRTRLCAECQKRVNPRIVGRRFGTRTVLAVLERDSKGAAKRVRTKCSCGAESTVLHKKLRRTKSCRACTKPFHPHLSGQRFDMLTVVEQVGGVCLCRCDCGNVKLFRGSALTGNTSPLSCGCTRRMRHRALADQVRFTRDPKTRTTWNSYKNAWRRCNDPGSKNYSSYGGRKDNPVQFRFQSFEQFVAEVGLRPPGTSIDRIDPEGHYEPGNVRWLNTARNGTRVATKSFSELCVGTA